MGNDLLCSKEQEIGPDIQFKYPEKKITTKIEESFDDQDELNIIEQIKTNKTNNNDIEQINTKSIIIESNEVMYERFDTIKKEPKENNFFYNSNDKLLNDKDGPQDNIKIIEKQITNEIIKNNLTEKKIETDFPLDSNEINKEGRYTDLIIDQNKIIITYISDFNKEENDDNNNDIDNNIKENSEIIVSKEINNSSNNQKKPIEKRIQDLVDISKKIGNNYYNNTEKKLQENENNFDNKINVENNKLKNIDYILENKNNIPQKYESSEQNDNINIENILPEKDINQIHLENSPNSSYINNNLHSESTFFPKINNNENNIDNSIFTSNNNPNNDYINEAKNNINQNTEQIYQNNIVETNYNNNLTFSNILKNAKKTNIISNNNYETNLSNNNYNYLYKIDTNEKPLFTDKEIDEMITQAEKTNYQTISYNNDINKKEVTYQQKSKNINQVYNNLILTPEKKKIYYPLTPDYQINNKRNNIIYYDINNYIDNLKTIGNNNNFNTIYTSIYNQPKAKNNVNYNYNTPKKINKAKQVMYKSPIKMNQPKFRYNTEIIDNSKIKYNRNINSNNYLSKKEENNTSIIDNSYLKSIQDMNQINYNVNSISSLYSDITNLNSSFISSCSKSPKKFDKKGNPIYFTSTSSNKKLKEYQNSKIFKRNNFREIKSLSYDDIRKKKNNFCDDISLNKSQISSLDSDLYSINSKNSIKFFKNMKKGDIYPSQMSKTSNIHNISNISILSSTSENIFLDIDESLKQIINKYITTDITSTSNFFPENYKLFYPSLNEYFKIPETERKKQIKYYINNDPSKIAIYIGGINALNQRHGLGQLKEPYLLKIGTWKNNEFNGWGRIIYNNGQVLEGKYYKGKLNGKGVYKYKDVLYIGDFRDNIREGKGVLINKKFRYKGQFNMGKIDGYGKIVFLENKEDIGEYEGFFKENNIEGKGTMRWRNGNIYQGDMKNGKMNGFGKFIPYQGIPIEGVFRNNVRVNLKK